MYMNVYVELVCMVFLVQTLRAFCVGVSYRYCSLAIIIEVMCLTSRLHESCIQPYTFRARQLLSEGDGGQLMVEIMISKAQTS